MNKLTRPEALYYLQKIQGFKDAVCIGQKTVSCFLLVVLALVIIGYMFNFMKEDKVKTHFEQQKSFTEENNE